MDRILIDGVKVWGKHGVLDFERKHAQSFTVDMEIWADISESYVSDDLQNTINYADVYEIIKSVIVTESFRLIERLSYVIMEKVFLYDPRIERIRIRVVKNNAPLEGQVNHVGIEFEKNREQVLTHETGERANVALDVNNSSIASGVKVNADVLYKAVLALGSNVGNRGQNIQKALEMLSKSTGINVLDKSKLYETEPVGYIDQEKFYNAAILIETTLNPFDLYNKVKNIEDTIGRKKTFKWGPRLIDIDIIAYEGCIVNTKGLTLPHKEYMQRAFVLKPLSDMPKAVEVAGLNMTLIEKMTHCADDNKGIKCIGNL